MGLLDKLFNRGGAPAEQDAAIELDVEARRAQLRKLESACDALANAMSEMETRMEAPGWRERIGEYTRAAGNAALIRTSRFEREQLLDLSFEVRPVFTGPPPSGLESLVPLQEAAVARAKDLAEVLPGERAS